MGKPGKRTHRGRSPRRGLKLYPLGHNARIRGDRLALGLGIALWLSLYGGAHAQSAPPAAGVEPAAPAGPAYESAREHFQLGMEHYGARRYREAVHEFRLSVTRVPNADLWFNMARAYEQLGEAAHAVEHYRLYLRDRVDAPDADDVQRRIEQLSTRAAADPSRAPREAQTGSLAVVASEPGALLLLDGYSLGLSPIDRVLHLPAGIHRLEASREGWIPFRAEIEVHPNAVSAGYVELRPRTQRRTAGATRVWTWIAAGSSAATLLVSGALGLVALDRRDAGDAEGSEQFGLASDLALGGGLALAVTATLLYFIEGNAGEAPEAGAR